MNAITADAQSATFTDQPATGHLRRSGDDRMLASVAGGIARSLGVDVTLVRLFAVGANVALHRTIWGRSVLAIGQNIRAAALAGIRVEPVRFVTYVVCGALGGINGALLAGYFRGANVDIGNEYLLASIAVVVIGGTSVSGGRANLPGVWGGALFLVLLLTMLNTFGVSAGVRLVATGLIIVAVITAAGGEKRVR